MEIRFERNNFYLEANWFEIGLSYHLHKSYDKYKHCIILYLGYWKVIFWWGEKLKP